jgi:hypothetical protein
MSEFQIRLLVNVEPTNLVGPDKFVTSQNLQNFFSGLSSGLSEGYMLFSQLVEGTEAEGTVNCAGMSSGVVVTIGQFSGTEGVDFVFGANPTETAQNIVIYFQSIPEFGNYLEIFNAGEPAGFFKIRATEVGTMGNAVPFSVTSGTASDVALSGGTNDEYQPISEVFNYNVPLDT